MRLRILPLIIILLLFVPGQAVADTVSDLNDAINYDEIDEYMMEHTGNSFAVYIEDVLTGRKEFGTLELFKNLLKSCYDNVFKDVDIYSGIYVLVASACLFMPMAFACKSVQVRDLTVNVSYLLSVSVLCGFYISVMSMVQSVLATLVEFMTLFIPAYLMGITFCTGSGSATAIYGVLLFAINISQKIILAVFVPLVNTYQCIAISNHFSKRLMSSKLSDLLYSFIMWGNRMSLGRIIGLSAIQSIVSPGVDRLRRSTVGEIFNVVPVFGNAFSGVSGTLLGASVVLKNIIGVAGITAILVLVTVPLFKIGFIYCVLRLTGALIQPVAGDKLSSLITDVSKGIYLLLRIAINTGLLFVLSLLIIALGTGL